MGITTSVFAAAAAPKKKPDDKTVTTTVAPQKNCEPVDKALATTVDDYVAGLSREAATPNSTAGEVWPPDQCGIENDGVKYVDWAGPFRIKETQLSAEKQAKFLGILEQVFSKETVLGRKLVLEPEDVIEVMNNVIPYLKSEPMLIEEVPFGVEVVGDLHGQLYDLYRVFRAGEKDWKRCLGKQTFVFLGNYVSRGRQSLEIVLALFCLKMLYPDRFFLLRGNHEYAEVNVDKGFAMDIRERYQKDVAVTLYIKVNAVFCYLSAAAIVGNSYLCVHSGISTAGFTRRQMKGIYKPFYEMTDDRLIHDMTLSEPALGIRGTVYNPKSHSFYFGYDALCQALDTMDVMAIFRGHAVMKEGYSVTWNTCITVFTASDHQYEGNHGAVALIDDKGKITFRILLLSEQRSRWEKMLAIEYPGLAAKKEEEDKKDIGKGEMKAN